MTPLTPSPNALPNGLVRRGLRAGLRMPRSLLAQVLLFAGLSLSLAVAGTTAYLAEAALARERAVIDLQMDATARNLALLSERLLRTSELSQLEALTQNMAILPGVYSLLLTDPAGMPLVEVVNHDGTWSPRFSLARVDIPPADGPGLVRQTLPAARTAHDFLAGSSGVLATWQRVGTGGVSVGWVKVSYRLDAFETLTRDIRAQAWVTIPITLLLALPLLWLLVRPTLRAVRRATDFAATLDTALGANLRVSRRCTEVQALGEALNLVSARLLRQNTDLLNQKFALDQHAIVSITTPEGCITYANARFCDISGYSQAELMGQNHRLIRSDEHPPAFFQGMWATISAGQVWHGEIRNQRRDGSAYWVNATVVPLLGADGTPQQYVNISTDISDQKALAHKLEVTLAQAQAAGQAKAQFLANMSHEIRTPMNAVLGMLRLLRNTALDRQQRDYAEKAESAAQGLLQILNDVLDYSKIEAGKMALDVHAMRLDKLLRDVGVIAAAGLGDKPVELLFDVAPDVPKALVADDLRLQQVLINLMGNAIKFTPSGEVTLAVHTEPAPPNDARVHLKFAVRDTGIGIAPEKQRAIFDSFAQAETSTTRRYGGTGLGLSISRKLVALMGGDLSLDSTPGQGSCFSFSLALEAAPDAVIDASTQALPAGLRVLLADDNPSARDVLAAQAQAWGWHVTLAESGEQALALLQAHAEGGRCGYDVCLIDWRMPGLDGWQTVSRLRRMGLSQMPVVVMVTAHGRERLHERSPDEQSWLDAFLVKPITASMLHDAVAQALARHGGTPAEPPPPEAPAAQPLRGVRLLVVEDNPVNQQVAQELLRQQGAEITLADNGQLGVQAVQQALADQTPFDAVLMDLQMPVMDGLTATRTLRIDLGLSKLPIIAMTANAMASDRQACLDAGMNEHVGKPFDIQQLVVVILKAVAEQPAPASLPPPAPEPPKTAGSLVPGRAPEPALPPEDAVDSTDALDRLGGDQALYAQVLGAFLADLQRQPDALRELAEQGQWGAATRLLHTQKGLASTVGASYLAAWARRHETRVKAWSAAEANPTPDAVAQLLTGFEQAVASTQRVMDAVAQSCQPAPKHQPDSVTQVDAPGAAATPEPNCCARLDALQALLNAHDLDAMVAFDALCQLPAVQAAAARPALTRALAEFDFVFALKCLSDLRTQLQKT